MEGRWVKSCGIKRSQILNPYLLFYFISTSFFLWSLLHERKVINRMMNTLDMCVPAMTLIELFVFIYKLSWIMVLIGLVWIFLKSWELSSFSSESSSGGEKKWGRWDDEGSVWNRKLSHDNHHQLLSIFTYFADMHFAFYPNSKGLLKLGRELGSKLHTNDQLIPLLLNLHYYFQ